MSRTLVALLKVFLLNPENAFYQRELVAAAAARAIATIQPFCSRNRNKVIAPARRKAKSNKNRVRAGENQCGLGLELSARLFPFSD